MRPYLKKVHHKKMALVVPQGVGPVFKPKYRKKKKKKNMRERERERERERKRKRKAE
jgi:hypothetical protein